MQIDPSQITLSDLTDVVFQIDPTPSAAIADLDADTKVKRRGRSDVKTEAVEVDAELLVAPESEAEIVDVQFTASTVETEDPFYHQTKRCRFLI